MHRRAFLGSAAATLALPGCATMRARTAAPAGCLPPVLVSPERVIRTVAGLRPYRAAGFVVRAEPLGDKRLVHNYGHGGAGITLSWGTSKLATLLGLQGHQGPVAVIGAGVMGLTTARLVQEAGFPVTLYAKALTPDTTSNIAGGQWSPFGHYRRDSVTPEWRAQFAAALDYSWRRFQIMVGDDYGIRWLPTYVDASEDGDDGPSPLDAYHPGRRVLAADEHPFALDQHRPLRHHVCRDRPLPAPAHPRRAGRRRRHPGARIRHARRGRDPARTPGLQLHRPRRRARCSATPASSRSAASSPSCCPSRRCATPSPARPATCSPAPTAYCSAAPSSAASGTRRPSPKPSPASSRATGGCSASFRCTA